MRIMFIKKIFLLPVVMTFLLAACSNSDELHCADGKTFYRCGAGTYAGEGQSSLNVNEYFSFKNGKVTCKSNFYGNKTRLYRISSNLLFFSEKYNSGEYKYLDNAIANKEDIKYYLFGEYHGEWFTAPKQSTQVNYEYFVTMKLAKESGVNMPN